MSKKNVDAKSLSEALEILERATKEGAADLLGEFKPEVDRIKKIWKDLGPTLHDAKEDLVDSGKEAAESAMRVGRDAIEKVNKRAKEEPWFLAAIVAMVALVIGFILGRRSE